MAIVCISLSAVLIDTILCLDEHYFIAFSPSLIKYIICDLCVAKSASPKAANTPAIAVPGISGGRRNRGIIMALKMIVLW